MAFLLFPLVHPGQILLAPSQVAQQTKHAVSHEIWCPLESSPLTDEVRTDLRMDRSGHHMERYISPVQAASGLQSQEPVELHSGQYWLLEELIFLHLQG